MDQDEKRKIKEVLREKEWVIQMYYEKKVNNKTSPLKSLNIQKDQNIWCWKSLGPAFEHAQVFQGKNWLIRSSFFIRCTFNWISNSNTGINKQGKTCTEKTTYYQKNERQHKHGQYNIRIIECALFGDN